VTEYKYMTNEGGAKLRTLNYHDYEILNPYLQKWVEYTG